jgi:hypothetical protein
MPLKFYAVATRRNLQKRRDSTWTAQDGLGVRLRFDSEAKAVNYARRACRDETDKSLLYPRAEICG